MSLLTLKPTSDKKVVAELPKFVCAKIDVDKERKVALALRIKSLPRTVILNVHGQVVGDLSGYVEADRFMDLLRDAHENAQKETEGEVVQIEPDVVVWLDDVDEATKKAEVLAKRFAPWYYVIDAKLFDALKLSRADVVKAKEEEVKKDEGDEAPPPDEEPGDDGGK